MLSQWISKSGVQSPESLSSNPSRKNPKWRTAILGITLFGNALPMSTLAVSDPDDHVNFSASLYYQYDDNLFRLPDLSSQELNVILGESDTSDSLLISRAGINVNTTFSLQTLQLNAQVSRYDYNRFDYLNFTGLDYDLLWDWRFTPDIMGTLSMKREDLPTTYDDYRDVTTANQRKLINRQFTLDGIISGGWSIIGRITQSERENSGQFVAEDSFNQAGLEGGIKYTFRSGSNIRGLINRSKGDYTDREADSVFLLDNQYDQQEAKIKAQLDLTAKSLITTEIGYRERVHPQFSERDYDGTFGSVQYQWLPTGKITINTSLLRELEAYQDIFSNYTVRDTFVITPIYQATEKLSLQFQYTVSNRDFEGTPFNFGSDPSAPAELADRPQRQDQSSKLSFSANWRLSHSFDLSLSLDESHRNSTEDLNDYDTYTVLFGINLQI